MKTVHSWFIVYVCIKSHSLFISLNLKSVNTHTHTHPAEEYNVLSYSQFVKENVVLWTEAKGAAHLIHLSHNVVTSHKGRTRGGWKQT